MSAPTPEAVRLARAAWDAATPATRVLFFLRSKRAALKPLEGNDLDAVPFFDWDELPAETAYALAWDVQFLSGYLRAGRDALRASEPDSGRPLRAVK